MPPQTYEYERGAARTVILARAKVSMDKALAAAWAGRSAGLPLAGEREEMLILASIVERERPNPTSGRTSRRCI